MQKETTSQRSALVDTLALLTTAQMTSQGNSWRMVSKRRPRPFGFSVFLRVSVISLRSRGRSTYLSFTLLHNLSEGKPPFLTCESFPLAAQFEAGTPPYNVTPELVGSMHRATDELKQAGAAENEDV